MKELKNSRIEMLMDCLLKLEEVKKLYTPSSPGWILIHTAQGHVKSLHHLESETNFDEETLGVILK